MAAGRRGAPLLALLLAGSATQVAAATPAADEGAARRLQGEACPDAAPYSEEPSPFGWPLTPADWSFSREDCWESKHLLCGGERQSPMDIDLTEGATYCDTARVGQNGTFKQKATYGSAGPLQVQISEYMGTAMAAGAFGELTVMEDGQEVAYDAVQVHLAAPSLHTVNGTMYDAELLVLHKPKNEPDMLRRSIIVSVLFTAKEGSDSAVFHGMGFDKEHGRKDDGHGGLPYWSSEGSVDLSSEVGPALEGASYLYEGSVPVPPCTENVKWVVLGSPQHVSPQQAAHLKATLSHTRGGARHRTPRPRNRCVAVNSADIGGDHSKTTCEADYVKGTWERSARCWDIHDRCHSKRFAAVDIKTDAAVEPTPEHPLLLIEDMVHYKPAQQITVSPSLYTLDAHVDNHGEFGHLTLNGHIYFAKNVSFKAVAQHMINGVRTEGELMIEHVMYGDTFGEGLPGYHADLHTVMVSVPLRKGDTNSLLHKLGLTASTSRTIRDGLAYHVDGPINLADELKPALQGKWYWYSSNSTHKDCGASVRWMVFETPLEISIEQLNYLSLPVSGFESSDMTHPPPFPQGHFWRQNLPPYAVEANETDCENLPQADWKYGAFSPHWDYGNERCWTTLFPVCGAGARQSPIDIPLSSVSTSAKDNFLSKCSWKPVADLRVANTGHNLQVTNEQLGYITYVNEQGFPDYYQIAQFHVHMPSEHMIGGRQYAAELHIVHKRQNTVVDLANDDLLVTAIMFDLGDEDSPVLNQLFLPNGSQALHEEKSYLRMKRPFDPMRAFGPVIDGPFYRYDGSLTTPPCSEVVKWFVFETPLSMSRQQWLAFKEMYPNPTNNRPVQPVNDREVALNSFQEGKLLDYRYFLNREMGRNRMQPQALLIIAPIAGTVLLCSVVMAGIFVREDRRRKGQSAGGVAAETIGKAQYTRF